MSGSESDVQRPSLPSIYALQAAFADLSRAGGATWEGDTHAMRVDRALDLAVLREHRNEGA